MDHFIDRIAQIIPGETAALKIAEPYFKPVTGKKNDLILKAGTICKKVTFIRKGVCYMYRERDGKEEVVEFYLKGMLCCDYVSFIKQKPAENAIRLLEDCELEQISHEDLHFLYDTQLPIERVGRIITESLYCGITRRMISYQNDSPEVRYKNLVEQRPELFPRVPQYLIAAYLGVTPVGLSKIRKRLGLVTAGH